MHVTLLKAGLSGGSFKYYVSKDGGWLACAKCLHLQGGWVGNLANTYVCKKLSKDFLNLVSFCHIKQKSLKKSNTHETWSFYQSDKCIFISMREKLRENLYVVRKVRSLKQGCWGSKNGIKCAYVLFEWSLDCLDYGLSYNLFYSFLAYYGI